MSDRTPITPVILCGGSGTRLWPLSRKSYPKQFSPLLGDKSLFELTVSRFQAPAFAAPVVVTGETFRFTVTHLTADSGTNGATILVEPSGRNTAPAALAASYVAKAQRDDTLILLAPADHLIPDTAAFHTAIAKGVPEAEAGKIVTFGIRPDRAETGYGYLETLGESDAGGPVPVRQFVEKPDAATAKVLSTDGKHLWNSGIFLASATTLIAAFEAHAPEYISPVSEAVNQAERDLGFLRLAAEPWEEVPSQSIDYAVMERADNIVAVPYDAGWSDLGGWDAVWREQSQDAGGVATRGKASAIDCTNTLLRSESDGIELVGIGLDNIVAVATDDAVLVADKSRSQDVKLAVERMRDKGARQGDQLPKDYRPWGWYESLVLGDRFQVKRIVVDPGAALSLQSHFHRSEHWIVVSGTARVTVDDEIKLISENQSVYIPVGAVHRMENPGKVPLVLIEVQTGSYLEEDDIVRYGDVYDRK